MALLVRSDSGLVGDIGTLKRLLDSLLHTYPVTHLLLLDSLLFASPPDPRNPTNLLRNPERHPWLLTDAGQTVVEVERRRCYRMNQVEQVAEGAPGAHPGLPPRTAPTLDPPPKWRALLGVLSKVLAERDAIIAQAVDFSGQPPGPIIVLTNGDRGVKAARELTEGAGIGVRRGDALGTMRTNGKRKRREDGEDSEAEEEDDGEDIVPGEVEGGEEAVQTVGGGDSDGESKRRS
ncbi:hypothetical protein M427DRAFT_269338 [Gonapodya prolifera JEL478]|uniref:Uncharacterized protein n=1 Tax=Gonapodya prolifera (strain JEL478) TaxID=1344416 RepID=A0A139AJV8_GONPJ|nr:hypothetical protein M427DRAFT_269338 [Gonapodya prolifera JEL478]|eukprot:KXS17051.1 hypothetical protein M427DRAFT_269338 [Gonapodya prolifera JEL478]